MNTYGFIVLCGKITQIIFFHSLIIQIFTHLHMKYSTKIEDKLKQIIIHLIIFLCGRMS